ESTAPARSGPRMSRPAGIAGPDGTASGGPGSGDRAGRFGSPHKSPSQDQGCAVRAAHRSEEHTSELQSRFDLVCRLLLENRKLLFQLLRLSLATPSRWTPLELSVFLHCVVVLLLTLLYRFLLFLSISIPFILHYGLCPLI